MHGPDELRALSRLAFDEVARVPGGIGGVHSAIAARAFGPSGSAARPARVAHDAVAAGVYGALGATARLAGAGTDALLARRPEDRPALSSSRRGAAVLGVVQGLRGDALELEGSALHQPMVVRVDGRPVPPEAGALAGAFPAAGPGLVVFLHGLMETELSWELGAAEREPYGERLARERGWTPVYVRFNSGRHISQNGRSLAELLEELVASWPVPVERLALVGHSMGGLVARSACHLAVGDGLDWPRRVSHVVSLGTPHMGAPLEEAVHVLSAAFAALPETRPFGGLLRRRSAGIRDLRRGSLVDEDWHGCDPDALRAAACAEVPLLDGATHCFVSATLTRSTRHPVGRLLGDLLVLPPSAAGRSRSRRLAFDAANGLELGGASHFALLNHPAVYERLRDWLGAPAG